MKLLYATSIELPSVRANRIQVVSMAQAFNQQLPGNFLLGIGQAKDIDLQVPTAVMGHGRSFTLAWAYLVLARREHTTHIYCREERLLFFMTVFNKLFFKLPVRFIYELHHSAYLHKRWFRHTLKCTVRVVSITRAMAGQLKEVGYPEGQILVAPDAVDIATFDIASSKEDARKRLQLPQEKHIVVYTGSIDEPWKGVGVLVEAAREFGDEYLFVIVGGKPHYVDYFYSLYPKRPNVELVGHRPHDEIPLYLRAADVVVLPNSAKQEISRLSTSPMKLFEYMAAGRPMVASDLPSLREVLNHENALLVAPDDPSALAEGIRTLVADTQRAAALAGRARRDVERYTWEKRATAILAFMQS